MAAFAMIRLIGPALQVRAEQAPLTTDDIDELYAETAPYADKLPAETKTYYDTLRAAADSAVGLPKAEVDEIVISPEVQEALSSLGPAKTMYACL